MTELLALHAVVQAPPDRVAEILLDVRPGGVSPLTATGVVEQVTDAGDEFVLIEDGSRLTVAVDRAARSVSVQGEWWFRGVTSVEPDADGSRVVYRIFNVADGHGWAVRFVARGPLNAAPGAFSESIRRLGERLGVPARVVD
jgi:hypothetical protein